ncbi:MAG: porin [Gammaproteobacteria bacterium]|nr:porin [Gammaproteobacteria bacterium]
MNKKLLAVAVSAALVAPAATMAADAFVYGHAQVEVASYSEDSTGSGKDGVMVEDNARGRLGVKASEDLGNGLKAIAQFEWRVNTDQGGNPAGNRVSQVGLTGGFGTFVMGNLKSPYKYIPVV